MFSIRSNLDQNLCRFVKIFFLYSLFLLLGSRCRPKSVVKSRKLSDKNFLLLHIPNPDKILFGAGLQLEQTIFC